MKKLIIFLSTLLFAISFPTLTGRVVDEANILSPQTKHLLEQKLKTFEQNTSNQIVVVTLKSLQGHSIEEYGYQLGRHWGIGQKGKDNGVLLIVAPKERKVRIEVGYGLEGTLTDAQSFLIINDIIIPYFKKGDFDTGVIKGVDAIMDTIKGTFKPDKSKEKESAFPLVAFGVIFLGVILSRFFSFLRRYLSAIFFAAFASIPAYYMFDSVIVAIIVAVVVFIAAAIFFKPPPPGDTNIIDVDNHYPHSTLGGFGGGDFGSGGFSGGGGGFGGGGSSGSW